MGVVWNQLRMCESYVHGILLAIIKQQQCSSHAAREYVCCDVVNNIKVGLPV